jgi:hypothetical protein
MRVTPEMKTEGGERLDKLADFLGTDEVTGIKVTQDRGEVRIIADSTSYPNEAIDLDPDTADMLADLLHQRAREARA